MTTRIAAIAAAVALFMTMFANAAGLTDTISARATEVPEGFVLEYADMLPGDDGNQFAVSTDGHFGYGLCTAQLDEDEFTLQLYTSDSPSHAGQDTYLRKLRDIDYSEELNAENSFVRWSSDNPAVATVDAYSGLITAVSAGCARITVSTVLSSGYSQALAFNVVVVPEGRIEGTNGSLSDYMIYRAQPWQREIIIDTNAARASELNWQIFRAEKVEETSDITDDVIEYFDISDTNGKVTINNLPAGTYTITAMPRKTEAGLYSSPDYGMSSGGIRSLDLDYLKITLVIPFDISYEAINLEYYNRNIYGTHDLLTESNMPLGLFVFQSSLNEVAYVDPDTGLIEARGVGVTTIHVTPVSRTAIPDAFGQYYEAAVVTGPAVVVSQSYGSSSGSVNEGSAVSGAAIGLHNLNQVDQGFIFDVYVYDSVALNSKTESIPAGTSTQLRLTVPNPYTGEIVWSSSNPKVATVDQNGIVQGLGMGSANILARIEVNGVTKTARCKVNVTNALAYADLNTMSDSIYVDETLSVRLGGDTLALSGEYDWSVSDENVAKIIDISGLNAVIKGLRPGTVVITAYDDNLGITATKPITIEEYKEEEPAPSQSGTTPTSTPSPITTPTPTPAQNQQGSGSQNGSGIGGSIGGGATSAGAVIYYDNRSSYYPGSSTLTTTPTPTPKAGDAKDTPTPTPTLKDDEPQKSVTTDRYGNVTTYEVIKNKDGSLSTIKTIENVDGSTSTVEMIEYADNSSTFTTSNTDAIGNKTVYTAYMNTEGKVIISYTENVTVDKYGEITQKTEITRADGSYSVGLRVTSKDGRSSYELIEVNKDGEIKLTLDNVYPNGETIHRIFASTDASKFSLKKYTTDRRIASVASNLMLSDNSKYEVVSVAKNSFKNNTSITRVTIGKNVTAIGKDAFRDASKLKNIVIYADKLKKVGKGAFKGIAKNAVIQIAGSKKKFESIKKKIIASGVTKGVTFKRIDPAE